MGYFLSFLMFCIFVTNIWLFIFYFDSNLPAMKLWSLATVIWINYALWLDVSFQDKVNVLYITSFAIEVSFLWRIKLCRDSCMTLSCLYC